MQLSTVEATCILWLKYVNGSDCEGYSDVLVKCATLGHCLELDPTLSSST